MSPLIHKSMTWAIVCTVVLMSAWLANSVQDKHERGGFRMRLATQTAVSAPELPATAPVAPTAVHAQAKVQVASLKR